MRGYKDLFEVQEYRSDYRKPTRKDFLHRPKKENVGFQNPLKEAISNRKVDKAYDLCYLRPVSKVAPSYMHRLLDLDGKKLLQPIKVQSDRLLDIRFSPKVLEERGPDKIFKNRLESVWKEPELLHSNKKVITSIASSQEKDLSKIQVDHGLHKSSWLRDVERPETIRRLSVSVLGSNIFNGFKMGLNSLKEEEGLKKETYSTRNVEFMLDIWQKSEGVNLDKFLQEEERVKYQKKIEAKERAMDLAKEKELRIQENQLYLQAFNASFDRNSNPDDEADKSKIKKPNENENLNTDGAVFQLTSLTEELSNIAEREVNYKRRKSVAVNTLLNREKHIIKSESFSSRSMQTPNKNGSLSKSTIKVLKKLNLEDNENSKSAIQALKSDDPNDLLKLTLTGPQEEDMQTYFLSDRNRSFVPIRVKRRHLETTYSPGAWSKLIKSSFLPNGEIRISESITNDIEQDKRQFQLILYDLNALDDEEDENADSANDEGVIIDEAEETDVVLPEILEHNSSQPPNSSKEDIRLTPMQRRLSKFLRRLSVYNKNMSLEKKILTLEELHESKKAEKEKERSKSGKIYFSLINFCALVKRFLKYHYEAHDGEPFGLPPMPSGAPPLNKLVDFISGPYCELECLPDNDLVARISLLRALSLALRETQQKELCYEAAYIIIKSGISNDLGRWDAQLLKDILTQMLSDGSRLEKDAACTAFCEANLINEHIIQHLRTGFGDMDDERRQMLNYCFLNLDLKFAPFIMDILIEEASSINFKVRIDVIHQLENYISRLSSTIEKPKVRNHKKHSSCDNLEINCKNMASISEPEEESVIDSMIFNSIEVLLYYMWEDWSKEVRDLSSSALGRLQQGNAIYNHLISLTSSEIPGKRLDALKCLGYMGLITKTTLPDFIESFKDPYTAIRLQACKVACKLKSDHRDLIGALLDSFSDSSWQIRAFAIKAVGLSKSQTAIVRSSLHWCMMHDEVPAVRAEAIVAFKNLGFIESHPIGKEWLITLLQTDTSDAVKKEAEKVLVESGVMLPSTDEEFGGDLSSLLARIPANLSLPFPNILRGKSKEEVEIFLRDSLIEDKEQSDVINQVRLLAKKEKVLQQVEHEERHSGILPNLEYDLNFDQDHIPNLKAIHKGQKTY